MFTYTVRSILLLLVVAISFLEPREARSQHRILFIGNSFTMGDSDASQRTKALGGVPVIFERLCRAGGHTNISVVMRAVGGQDFQFHDQDPTSLTAINSQPWDYVVMHTFSIEPTHFVDGIHSIADHMAYGESLYRRIMTNNPQTRVILKETWSRAVGHPYITGITTTNSFASTDEFQTELRTNYLRLANYLNVAYPTNHPVVISPVGDAWENAGGMRHPADPGFVSLYASDLWHGNDNGHYLSAAVTYCVIYNESPHGFHTNPAVAQLNLNLTVSPAYLEDAAWATVRNRDRNSQNVTLQEPLSFFQQPSSLTVMESKSAKFKAVVLGSPPFSVSWTSNGIPIPEATDFTYTIPAVTVAMNGSAYAVTVSNLTSTTTSTNALLTVVPEAVATPVQSFLVDFGGASTTGSGQSPDDPARFWNNITETTGLTPGAQSTNLVTSSNQPSTVSLVMLRRFASFNETGTLSFPQWPQDATRDSLYGNTELYGGMSNVFPQFKLTGLNPALRYNFDFYASRMGVTDNRETAYSLQGLNSGFGVLDVANNISNVARVFGVSPTLTGEITVSIGPTTNNNNAFHFTYLGIMKVTAVPLLTPPDLTNDVLTLRWQGDGQLEVAPDLDGPWTRILPTPVSPYQESIRVGEARFFRLFVTP